MLYRILFEEATAKPLCHSKTNRRKLIAYLSNVLVASKACSSRTSSCRNMQQLMQKQMPTPGIDAQLMLKERGELCQVGGSGNGTDALAIHVAQRKKLIRQRLVLLRHASKCRVGPSCSVKFCPQMVVLWKHMRSCDDKSCKTAFCLSSRCVLNHYRNCKGENRTEMCEICSPVMKHFRAQAAANESMKDLVREAQTVSIGSS